MPVGRPAAQAQIGPVPGFYASRSAFNKAQGAPIMHLSALVDLDRWLPTKGILVGGRLFGEEGDTPGEPYIGYRKKMNDAVCAGVIGFGSTKRSTEKLASYHGVRLGAEGMLDAQLVKTKWFGLHGQAAVSATRILMSGNYCVDDDGVAKDCNVDDPSRNTMISGKAVGVYPAMTISVAGDFGKHVGTFDSARLAIMAATGSMPLVVDGVKIDTAPYFSVGATLTIGIGLGESDTPVE